MESVLLATLKADESTFKCMHRINHLPRHDAYDSIRISRRDIAQRRRRASRREVICWWHATHGGAGVRGSVGASRVRAHEHAEEVQGSAAEWGEPCIGCRGLAIHACCRRLRGRQARVGIRLRGRRGMGPLSLS